MLCWPVGTSVGDCVKLLTERMKPSVGGTGPEEGVLELRMEKSG